MSQTSQIRRKTNLVRSQFWKNQIDVRKGRIEEVRRRNQQIGFSSFKMGNVFLFPLRVFIGPRKTLMSQLPTSTSLKHFPATKSSPGFDLYYQIAKGTEEAGGEHRDWLPSWNHGAGWGHFVGLPTWLLGSVSMLAFGGTKLTLRSDAPAIKVR
jgi:hypothetical protein